MLLTSHITMTSCSNGQSTSRTQQTTNFWGRGTRGWKWSRRWGHETWGPDPEPKPVCSSSRATCLGNFLRRMYRNWVWKIKIQLHVRATKLQHLSFLGKTMIGIWANGHWKYSRRSNTRCHGNTCATELSKVFTFLSNNTSLALIRIF